MGMLSIVTLSALAVSLRAMEQDAISKVMASKAIQILFFFMFFSLFVILDNFDHL
jgi:hypothetical protein